MCLAPLTAWRVPSKTRSESQYLPQTTFGKIKGQLIRSPRTITFRRSEGVTGSEFKIPCGKCPECLKAKRQEWSTRIRNEASLYDSNKVFFLTLTYNDANLPLSDSGKPTLRKRDVQLFLKRLRKVLGCLGARIRFYCVGEYGSRYSRPHYHLIIFGHDFADRRPLRRNGRFLDYISATVSKCWTFGFHTLNEYSDSTANYISGYVTKKLTKRNEISADIEPEFHTMSNRRGIGYGYFSRNLHNIFRPDSVRLVTRNGVTGRFFTVRVPSAYWNWLKSEDEALYRRCKLYVRRIAMSLPERSLSEAIKVNDYITNSLRKEKRAYET